MIDDVDPNTPDKDLNPVTPPVTPTIEPSVETTPPAEAATPAIPAEGSASAVPTEEIKPLPKRKTLSIIIHDAGVLRAAYMQFVKGGGLFIPTKKTFTMGEDTNLVIRLLGEDEPYNVTGKVVWITPAGSPNNKAGGIGVEFMEDKNGEKLRNRIELLLGPHLQSTESTHTM